ncbi:hypothetical protein CY0110_17277 [Crocosphaera chwakensis CCY0110]|uniref:Uncharacterized protein n=1 Tax=Crocosphaera chwakensis CCY0110 TaxID=391612 RepID=A3IID7_9CHRO|nr:hypothetical protein CY0110_17277 [Crocosphaera chwakensis CCY0110]
MLFMQSEKLVRSKQLILYNSQFFIQKRLKI